MNKLPEKLSDLIDVALVDLDLAEKDENYCINMSDVWHVYHNKSCHVCFAGGVMAGTLGVDRAANKAPCDFDDHTNGRLRALNQIRVGEIGGGLFHMSEDCPLELEVRRFIPHYREGPEAFKTALKQVATDLRQHDL